MILRLIRHIETANLHWLIVHHSHRVSLWCEHIHWHAPVIIRIALHNDLLLRHLHLWLYLLSHHLLMLDLYLLLQLLLLLVLLLLVLCYLRGLHLELLDAFQNLHSVKSYLDPEVVLEIYIRDMVQ